MYNGFCIEVTCSQQQVIEQVLKIPQQRKTYSIKIMQEPNGCCMSFLDLIKMSHDVHGLVVVSIIFGRYLIWVSFPFLIKFQTTCFKKTLIYLRHI